MFPVCSATVCVCVHCFGLLCLVYLFVRCSDITRSSTIWSLLKDLHRLILSASVWKYAIQRYPPLRRKLTLCADVDWLTEAAVQNTTNVCRCFSILISLQAVVFVLRNLD